MINVQATSNNLVRVVEIMLWPDDNLCEIGVAGASALCRAQATNCESESPSEQPRPQVTIKMSEVASGMVFGACRIGRHAAAQ
jgi:hypothetical protein